MYKISILYDCLFYVFYKLFNIIIIMYCIYASASNVSIFQWDGHFLRLVQRHKCSYLFSQQRLDNLQKFKQHKRDNPTRWGFFRGLQNFILNFVCELMVSNIFEYLTSVIFISKFSAFFSEIIASNSNSKESSRSKSRKWWSWTKRHLQKTDWDPKSLLKTKLMKC